MTKRYMVIDPSTNFTISNKTIKCLTRAILIINKLHSAGWKRPLEIVEIKTVSII